MEGTQIGAYRIERQLGRGGFGVVWVGIDSRLGRRVAVKQLLPELSHNRDIVERFFMEARAAANINHPGIVEVYEVGWHTDGSAYFAMKLLEGDSLAKRLRAAHTLAIPFAATVARQVASALAAAHARGIVHRDLKPDNIVLVRDEEVAIRERATVLDFGIAKLFGDQRISARTATGSLMGTPSYMSPEQCRGAGEVDHRTDIYALGCILYEMLAGRPPHVGEGGGEVLGMHQFVETPMLRSFRPDAPPELEAVVMRSLAKKPDERYAQMSDFVAALQPFTTAAAPAAPAPSGPVDPRAATMLSVVDVADANAPTQGADLISEAARAANRLRVTTNDTTLGASSAERVAVTKRSRRVVPFVIAGVALVAAGTFAVVKLAMRDEPQTGATLELVAVGPADAAPLPTIDGTVVAADRSFIQVEFDKALVSDLRKARALLVQLGPDEQKRFEAAEAEAVSNAATMLKSLVDDDCRAHRQHLDEVGRTMGPEIADKARDQVPCTPKLPPKCARENTNAKEAEARGNNASALTSYEKVLRCTPYDPELLKKVYVLACRTKNHRKAHQYFKRLAPAVQSGALLVCMNQGIDPRTEPVRPKDNPEADPGSAATN